MLKIPVLFLIFNRPELTFRVFEEIRKAKPEKLFIAADGPRAGKVQEAEKCAATRKVIEKIDWQCEVKTLFREKNLGCKVAVSSAINWFFDHVEEGVILEDDCLPNQSFFIFCEAMLEKYRTEEMIMHIGGANFQDGIIRGAASYYFSIHPNIWGWATWKRAWVNYKIDMQGLEKFKEEQSLFKHPRIAKFNFEKLDKTTNGEINTWDYQWFYSIWESSGICIIPNLNLITNIGFGENATHTTEHDPFLAEIASAELKTINHPTKFSINIAADNYYSWKLLGYKNEFDYFMFELKKKVINYIYPIYKKIKK